MNTSRMRIFRFYYKESMHRAPRRIYLPSVPQRFLFLAFLCALLISTPLVAQDNVFTGTNTGVTTIRIAAADFKAGSTDAQTAPFKRTFDTTLYSDLANAGIFDIVSKSLLPQVTPGAPAEISLAQWSADPVSAAMVAFGSLGVQNGRLVVNGYLFDAKNNQYPQVLAKQ